MIVEDFADIAKELAKLTEEKRVAEQEATDKSAAPGAHAYEIDDLIYCC